jgi:hypothetical protein
MSNYVPRHTKKRETRCRREEALTRLVERGVSGPKLIRAAEDVLAARVRELRARLATIPPADGPGSARSARIAAEIEALRATPVEAILLDFGVGQAIRGT